MISLKASDADISRINKQLGQFSQSTQGDIIIRVFEKAARVVEMQMKADAPVSPRGSSSKKYPSRTHRPGYLRDSIGTIISKGRTFPTVWVRPRTNIGGFDSWYEHLPQMQHATGKGAVTTKFNPFVKKSWDKVKGSVEAGISSLLEKELQKELDKL